MPPPPIKVSPIDPKLVIDVLLPAYQSVLTVYQHEVGETTIVTIEADDTCDLLGSDEYALDPTVEVVLRVRRNGVYTQETEPIVGETGLPSVATAWATFEIRESGEYRITVSGNAEASEPPRQLKRASKTEFSAKIVALPTIAIETPGDGATVSAEPGTVTVTGSCTGTGALSVGAFVGADRYDASVSGSTWSANNVRIRQLGALTIRAAVEDEFGRRISATPRIVTVEDFTPPKLTVDAPAATARILGAQFVAFGKALDAGSGVAKVEWSLDGTDFRAAALSEDGEWSVSEKVDTLGSVRKPSTRSGQPHGVFGIPRRHDQRRCWPPIAVANCPLQPSSRERRNERNRT
jgi:hypothetical protein